MKIQLKQLNTFKEGILIIPISEKAKVGYNKIKKNLGIDSKLLESIFYANSDQIIKFYSSSEKIFFIDCGTAINFNSILQVFKKLYFNHLRNNSEDICIDFSYLQHDALIVQAAINGLILGTYEIGSYKSKNQKITNLDERKIQIVSKLDKSILKEACRQAIATAKTQLRVMDLVNAPSNKLLPTQMANWAVQSGKKNGFNVTVFDKEKCQKIGLHSFLAVNRGSEFPPQFVIMEYKPKSKKKIPKIGLVGKGVTFDTGGLSIKGHQNMHYMKSDMGGAAAVMGTMELTAKLQLPLHLIAITPITDNCVDATATKPGDIIDSYAGKTIEVIDTDAEGRLIMADALAYLNKNYKPDTLIDVATLTGSTVRTLGYHAGGLFSNNQILANQLLQAGQKTGERLWQLPIWDDYLSDIHSDVADIKNFSGRPLAGAIIAAKFLEFFIDNHPSWAHLDIAGVAFGNSGLSKDKSATAFGVHLLVNFLQSLSK